MTQYIPTAARAVHLQKSGKRIQQFLPYGDGDHPVGEISDLLANTRDRYPGMVVATIK